MIEWEFAGDELLLDWPEASSPAVLGALMEFVADLAQDPKRGAVRLKGRNVWLRPIESLPGVVVTFKLLGPPTMKPTVLMVSIDRLWSAEG